MYIMMFGLNQHVLFIRQPNEQPSDQRGLRDIEAEIQFLVYVFRQRCFLVRGLELRKVNEGQRDVPMRQNMALQLMVSRDESCSKNFVPANKAVNRFLQPADVELSRKVQARMKAVCAPSIAHLLQEADLLLGIGKCVLIGLLEGCF